VNTVAAGKNALGYIFDSLEQASDVRASLHGIACYTGTN